ncbi:hypothetical protein DFP73DRAFT_587912 [Morchella snyderi]|nr:hypothetical protein DFP73DRAFT_587912 [Morchella snyderi]
MTPLPLLTLASVFEGNKEIGDIVKSFDFSKVNVNDKSTKAFLTTKLAPSYGTLTSESIKLMDEQLKVMITATTKVISKIPPEERSWEKVISALKNNSLIEPMEGGNIDRTADPLTKSGTNVFKVDGSPNNAIVKEVETWFQRFISDSDILNATQIDIKVLGNIVAQTGATIDSFEAFFVKNEYHEKNLIDIGVLRYPDLDHPYFRVYRIELKAWSQSKRILFVQEDSNGITGRFQACKFKPRKSTMDALRPETVKKAAAEAEDFLN